MRGMHLSTVEAPHRHRQMHVAGKTIQLAPNGGIPPCGPRIVRMAVDRCLQESSEWTDGKKLVAYDPLCGNGVIPAVLSGVYRQKFRSIFASDEAHAAVETTRGNLSNQSDRGKIAPNTIVHPTPPFIVFEHNIFSDQAAPVPDGSVEFVLTDPPYGKKCSPVMADGKLSINPSDRHSFFDALFALLERKLAERSIVGVITDAGLQLSGQWGRLRRTAEPSALHIQDCSHHDRLLHIFKREQ